LAIQFLNNPYMDAQLITVGGKQGYQAVSVGILSGYLCTCATRSHGHSLQRQQGSGEQHDFVVLHLMTCLLNDH
jgi:hypothetical protein